MPGCGVLVQEFPQHVLCNEEASSALVNGEEEVIMYLCPLHRKGFTDGVLTKVVDL